MGFEIRQLEKKDICEIESLFCSRNELFKAPTTDAYKKSFDQNMSNYFTTNPNRFSLGAFKNQKLWAMMSIYIWEQMPYATILNVKTERGESLKTSGIAACLDLAIDRLELRNIFRIFYRQIEAAAQCIDVGL